MKLFNTLSRKKEEFKPIGNIVGIYTCGPTVYWYQHIGNLRSYIFADTLVRILKFNNFKVQQVMNVTDVGHLTSDEDEGEDKMEKAAKKEGKSAQDIAEFYLKIFKEDFKKLNITEPDIWCKASLHIEDQIKLIEQLEENGYVYKTSDGIYFDTSKFKGYGKLSKLDVKGLQAGKRVEMREKKNPTDFALWKFSEKQGHRQQEWNSPWGVGFPGWHIECSAMSMKYLGEHFDIHSGGIDHIGVHHNNEIAQSEAATGKKFVNYWLHGAFLTNKGEKVSKSKGGLYTIAELEELGFKPLHYRYLVLTAHYRSELDFTLKALEGAKISYERLKNILSELKDDKKVNQDYLDKFKEAINDDMNMPQALAVLWEMLRDKDADGKIGTLKEMDKVFGLDLLKEEKIVIPKEVKELVQKREEARENKDWKEADKIRNKIKEMGYIIEDSPSGPKIKAL